MIPAMIFQGALVAACLAVAVYCHVLARRLRRLNDLETGLGGAIAVMTAEVARLEAAIAAARTEAEQAGMALAAEVERARDERLRLRLGVDPAADTGLPRARRLRRRMAAEAETRGYPDA